MKARKEKEFVAVKVEGRFTEYYSPFFTDPYEDDGEYREHYENNILPIQPVLGPSLGDSDNHFLTGDLNCLAERLACDCEGSENTAVWGDYTEKIADAIEAVLKSGEAATHTFGGLKIIITPFKRGELPPINEEQLKVYGKYANLIRERVAAI